MVQQTNNTLKEIEDSLWELQLNKMYSNCQSEETTLSNLNKLQETFYTINTEYSSNCTEAFNKVMHHNDEKLIKQFNLHYV
jgi:hypothetical protein